MGRSLYYTAQNNAEINVELIITGYPAEQLAEEAADVETLAQLKNIQETAKHIAKESTKVRDARKSPRSNCG